MQAITHGQCFNLLQQHVIFMSIVDGFIVFTLYIKDLSILKAFLLAETRFFFLLSVVYVFFSCKVYCYCLGGGIIT